MFKHLGYYKEFYVENKFIGTILCEPDREVIGYNGRLTETLAEKIITKNNRIIKAGTKVVTILYPLNGSMKS